MKIPSPDAILLSAADKAMVLPQRRGLPLPGAMAVLEVVVVLLHAVAILGIARSGIPHAVTISAIVLAIGFMPAAFRARRAFVTMRSDARAWGPGVAMRYRARAMARREGGWLPRTLLLAATFVTIVALGVYLRLGEGAVPGVSLPSGFLGLFLGLLAQEYAACAMPRDPDLLQGVAKAA